MMFMIYPVRLGRPSVSGAPSSNLIDRYPSLDMRKRPKDPVKSKTTRGGSKLRSGSKASGKISKKVPLNICEKSKRRKFMQLYSTTKKPLNERFTKIMKQRKKLKIFEEIEIQVNTHRLAPIGDAQAS